MIQTLAFRTSSATDQRLPRSTCQLRTWKKSRVTPEAFVDQFRSPLTICTRELSTGESAATLTSSRLIASPSSSLRRGPAPFAARAPDARARSGQMMMKFEPIDWIWEETLSRAPAPSAVTVTTAVTPMRIPSTVSEARSTLRRMARKAMRMARAIARIGLLRPQGFDGVHLRGAPRGEVAKRDSDERARPHGDDEGKRARRERP